MDYVTGLIQFLLTSWFVILVYSLLVFGNYAIGWIEDERQPRGVLWYTFLWRMGIIGREDTRYRNLITTIWMYFIAVTIAACVWPLSILVIFVFILMRVARLIRRFQKQSKGM